MKKTHGCKSTYRCATTTKPGGSRKAKIHRVGRKVRRGRK